MWLRLEGHQHRHGGEGWLDRGERKVERGARTSPARTGGVSHPTFATTQRTSLHGTRAHRRQQGETLMLPNYSGAPYPVFKVD